MTGLAKEIIGFRARHNMSQSEFAKLAGVAMQTVYNIENGRHKPSKIVEYKIRQVLDNEVLC